MGQDVCLHERVVTCDEFRDVRLTARYIVERMVDDGLESSHGLHDGRHDHAATHLGLSLRVSD